jgi:transmembrane sensor
MKPRRQGAPDIGMEAAEWLEQMENNPDVDRAAFQRWLARSPEHVEAILNISALDRVLDDVDPEHELDVQSFVAEAQRIVVPLQGTRDTRETVFPRGGWPRWRFSLAVAATLVIGIAVTWALLDDHTYSTDIGEQRTVQLPDGSTVNLGTRSSLVLDFTDSSREVRLEGEALFKVRRDPARPFRVHGGPAVIQAVGTQFNVHRRPSSTVVSVTEGSVLAESSARTVQLKVGEEALIGRDGAIEQRPLRTNAIAGRRQGRLNFSDDRLEDIVAEFNRWNERQLKAGDAATAARLYNGSFEADDPDSFIAFLKRDKGLKFQERRRETVISQAPQTTD